MAKVTNRPYIPFGSYANKKAAQTVAKTLPWPCVPYKSKVANTFGLVRKDKS